MAINELQPKEVFENFYSLTRIPRPSKKEAQVIAFMKKFGEDLGLETIVDKAGNVIIRKPATPGYENRKGIILQAHLDMVPQKNADTVHDFEKDPIETYVDNGWVRAKGTTLGADDGLAAKNLEHGPIEGLFTIDEETGMTGANQLAPGVLKGDILLNMDSETEGELYVGCAGGIDTNAYWTPKMEKVADGMEAFQLVVKGLKGGHSGMDINLGRGNANKIMNTLLIMTAQKFGVRLATINGGSLRNAIPRESFATVVVPADKADKMKKFVEEYNTSVKEQFAETEPDLNIYMETAEMPKEVIDNKTLKNMLEAIAKYPNGVIGMSKDFEGTVETSSNLALVKFENGKIITCSLQRGLVDELKDKLADDIRKVLTEHGATAESSGSYHGWKPNIDSPILATMKKVYSEKFGKEPKVMVIHAGLECGILGAKYPNWDMISFGPTLVHPHSPDEALLIESVAPFWEFLVETLKNAPVK